VGDHFIGGAERAMEGTFRGLVELGIDDAALDRGVFVIGVGESRAVN